MNNLIKIQLITCLFTINNMFGQGGWNIGYRPIQMIKKKSDLIGKEIRIDFRQNPSDLITDIYDSAIFLSHRDLVKLKISKKNILFKEVWEIHSDSGFISRQYIESTSLPKIKITEMNLEKISSKAIVVSALLISPQKEETINISIDRNKIKGILFKVSFKD